MNNPQIAMFVQKLLRERAKQNLNQDYEAVKRTQQLIDLCSTNANVNGLQDLVMIAAHKGLYKMGEVDDK